MTDRTEAPFCGVDGCSDGSLTASAPVERGAPTLALEVVSDAICPWCWVAKRRLDDVLDELFSEVRTTVTWLPFELNPDMPKAGADRRAYRSSKFGSWAHSQQLDAQVASVGAADGLEFRHERMARTPNTFDAHRLIRLAGQEGKQGQVVERLFVAYFRDGLDVGATDVLVSLGKAGGLDPVRVSAMLASNEGAVEVKRELDRAARLRISGVPTVISDGQPLFSGAIRPELMKARLRKAAGLG